MPSPDRPCIPTPLLTAVNTRKINIYTKAFLYILSPSPTSISESSVPPASISETAPSAPTHTELAPVITNILHAHLIPSTRSAPIAIPGLIRVVLQLLCIQSTSAWAASQVVLWWSGGGGGSNSEWKEGVDDAIRKLVILSQLDIQANS